MRGAGKTVLIAAIVAAVTVVVMSKSSAVAGRL